jgi:hypothetical protein
LDLISFIPGTIIIKPYAFAIKLFETAFKQFLIIFYLNPKATFMKIKASPIILVVTVFLFNSCKKNDDSTTPPPTPEELLTKSSWNVNEERWSQVSTAGGGATYYYKRGTTGNIGELDNGSLVFATNNTGTFTLGSTVAPITWQFTDAGKTKIQWTITYSPGNTQTVNWENVTITTTELHLGEYFTTSGGLTSLAIATYTH